MKSNLRFVAIWGLAAAVLTAAVPLVPILGIAGWSTFQVTIVLAETNTASALVLALVAHFTKGSTEEPAAVTAATTAFVVASIALGPAFGWWALDDQAAIAVQTFALALLALVLGAFNRQTAYAPTTVMLERRSAPK